VQHPTSRQWYTPHMEQPRTNPVDWVGTEHLGFVINAAFSKQNTDVIMAWLEGLKKVAPEGLYAMEPEGLHITVLDWVAPLFDYNGADKRALYEKLHPSYDEAFRRITAGMGAFAIHFTEVRVTPGAIILVGQDAGQFQSIRSQLMDSVSLPEGGKQPPNIVHSSLARFVEPAIELAPLEEYAANNPIDITQRVDEFRLVETRREPMQDFDVVGTYKLAS